MTDTLEIAAATPSARTGQPPRRSVERLLVHLDYLVEHSRHMLSKSCGQFETGGRTHTLPR
ncbi:MAG TPA: hypothetical protein VMB21_03570, partial [Candidatus Limnocylindria bacterium]|nr:hypothetical protein [Candidatus Limnocylindria bacterium]